MGHKVDRRDLSKNSPRRPASGCPAARQFLFVGGQHHGSMLPVCDASLLESSRSLDPCLRPSPEAKPYAGYRSQALKLAGGGVRLLAVHESCRRKGVDEPKLIDALAAALDNHERALAYRKRGGRVPLNASLPDEPGRPAHRKKTRADCGE